MRIWIVFIVAAALMLAVLLIPKPPEPAIYRSGPVPVAAGKATFVVDAKDPAKQSGSLTIESNSGGGDFEIEGLTVDGMRPKEKMPQKVGKLRSGDKKIVRFHFDKPISHGRWISHVNVRYGSAARGGMRIMSFSDSG